MADATTVGGVGAPRSYAEYQNQQRSVKTSLGKNDFLTLLAAQLQYQDPMEPLKDTDFIAQLAQFSSLEQMSGINTMMTQTHYYSLVGKFVYAEVRLEDGSNVAVEGFVDRIVNSDGKMFAQVNGYLIDASTISQVYDKDLFTGGNQLLETANLIGKTVKASLVDDAGERYTVSGLVTRVAAEDGVISAYLETDEGEKSVPVGNIMDISK